MAAYDGSLHQSTYTHSPATCRSCNAPWQMADFGLRVDRIAPARRAYKRDDLIGRSVTASRAYGFSSTGAGRFLARDVSGTVWSEADPTMIGSRKGRACWIADGQSYYVASVENLSTL